MTAEVVDPRPSRPPLAGSLTRGQRDVLVMVADGKPNAQIGRELHLAEDSVKSRLRVIFRLLGARDRAHAVFLALKAGWIQ